MPAKGAIEDEVQIIPAPGEPVNASLMPASPNVTLTAPADQELVTAMPGGYFLNLPRTLPWSIDEITGDFGAETYEEMLKDPHVRACVNTLKAGVLQEEPQIKPAVDQKEDEGFEESATMVERVERMFSDLQTPLADVLWDMMDAFALGNKVAEMKYSFDQTLLGEKMYSLVKLAPRPRSSTAFVVDVHFNVMAMACAIPGRPFGPQIGTILTDLKNNATLLPRSKFAVFTFRPVNDDPRGTSLLRPAFSIWNEKREIRKSYAKYLSQFATPSLIGKVSPQARPTPRIDPNTGKETIDPETTQPVIDSPVISLLAALRSLQNGSAGAFPAGTEIDKLEMAGDGAAYLQALNLSDRTITRAILNQDLATQEGQHQSRAATASHKDILDVLVLQAKRPVQRMLEHDVLRVWMGLNGYDLRWMPRISLGVSEAEDRARLWAGFAALVTAGYVDDSQKPETDILLGLPQREGETLEDLAVGGEQAATQLQDPNGAPIAGPPQSAASAQNTVQKASESPQTTSNPPNRGNGTKPPASFDQDAIGAEEDKLLDLIDEEFRKSWEGEE